MTQSIVLGGGCFWCLEAAYQTIKGVTAVASGYAGGQDTHPTYEKVCEGITGHAEVVQVTFDRDIVSLQNILNVFWVIHDPTTLDRQGGDVGTQYRSIILYSDASDLPIITHSLEDVAQLWSSPIVTEVGVLKHFYPAEDYHQNYFRNHPEQGYCQAVINPKLVKLRSHFVSLLSETS